ncbi:hypothetical protein H6P81_016176 [Aristolochia fimbriata]|uniref:Uncharacterized protein n=1 Tax=Aristolochia fimbriata TaxID=158543 RepID=A0AAV7EAG6_ARIFI|nr:hypothetical protein H6P81_016176 [Aristolochia fimbriata]
MDLCQDNIKVVDIFSAIQKKDDWQNACFTEAKRSNKGIDRSFSGIQVNNHTLEIHLYCAGKGSIDLPTDLYGPLISAIAVTPEFETGDKKKLLIAVKAGIAVGSAFVLFLFILIFLWKVGFLCSKEEARFKRFHVGMRLGEEFSVPYDKSKSHKAALVFCKHVVPTMDLLRATFAKEWLIKRNSFVYFLYFVYF